MQRDTFQGTLAVAAILCIVCSVIVSGAAVGLGPRQDANKVVFQRKNILEVVGLKEPDERISTERINQLFENIDSLLIDLQTGEEVTDAEVDEASFDQRQAAKDPKLSVQIPSGKDIAGIKRREKYSRVYVVREDGKIKNVVLPVYGKGLWSTLYGFVAIESDLETVCGITFFEHRETPGLGGEVENKEWKGKWQGKRIYDESGQIQIEVVKGAVTPGNPREKHQIDGISGATITSRGVSNLIRYWISQEGFGPFLQRLKKAT